MRDFVSAVRYSVRKHAASPGPSLLAVLAFGSGLALVAVMVGTIDAYFLRGLPFEGAERLVHIEQSSANGEEMDRPVMYGDFEQLRRHQTRFSHVLGWTAGTMNLADGDVPVRGDGAWVSPEFLDALGVTPVAGRTFHAEDAAPNAHGAVMISYRLWQARYGGSDDALGREVRVNSEPATLVGVMPKGFAFPLNQELWMPLKPPKGELEVAGKPMPPMYIGVIGKLAPGVAIEQARSELAALAPRLEELGPPDREGLGFRLTPYADEFVNEGVKKTLALMSAAVALVLLVACFNVANLLIGRAVLRRRELAIRSALGAGRLPLVASLVLDAAVLAVAGGAVGLAVAHVGLQFLGRAMASQPGHPFWVEIYLSPQTIWLTLSAAFVAALIAGAVPAFLTSDSDLRQVLSDASRGTTAAGVSRITQTMVVVQVAISAALLIAAALVMRSLVASHTYDHAFDGSDLLVARLGLMEAAYPTDEERLAFFEELRQAVASRPEVRSAALGTAVPVDTSIGAPWMYLEGPAEDPASGHLGPRARMAMVSPEYFETLGVPILAGRAFTAADGAEAPKVVIVNQRLAERQWPGENPLGRKLVMLDGEDPNSSERLGLRVVGVVPDLRFGGFADQDNPQQGFYVPLAQKSQRFAWLVVETHTEPTAFLEPLRRTVLELDADLPLYFVRSFEQVLDETLLTDRVVGGLFTLFALVALFLACLGLYALLAFSVGRRMHEIGIRMALGADRKAVVRMVLGRGSRQTLVGLVPGIALGGLLSMGLETVLFDFRPWDPVVFASVPLAFLAATTFACLSPAEKAARVDPVDALRQE
ncbi:MAG: ADOP family duplicated permease [Holophagales bacterium]|nr:ADOP family duplicated permease [Holophagales bacterium]